MTRINTNVSSLNAQKSLARSNSQLQEALTRLSTGLRINSGRDDPAGLIASEVLRSDIISVQRAITNSERANQMIATADSSLGQVSGLLNDIRGLVSDAANTGALSSEQIAANQLQVDSSLEAIDRIAQVTAFQGKRLLDGNMDFITAGVSSSISALQVDQANFGTQSEIAVSVDVAAQATQGQLNYAFGAIADEVVLQIGGSKGFEAFSFAANSSIDDMAAAINLVSDALGVTAEVQTEATAGSIITTSAGADNDIVLTATQEGLDEGDIDVRYVKGDSTATTINFTAKSGSDSAKVVVELKTAAWVAASVTQLDDAGLADSGSATYTLTTDAGNDNGALASVVLTASAAGAAYSGATVNIVDGRATGVTAGNESVIWDAASKTLTVGIEDGVTTMTQLSTAINTDGNFTTGGVVGGGNAVSTAFGDTLVLTTVGVGEEDNNALDITARIDGAQFNGTDVNFVSGNAAGTQVGINNNFNQSRNNYYGDKLAAGGDANNFWIEANLDGDYAGANGANLTIDFVQDGGVPAGTANVTLAANTLTITADFPNVSANEIIGEINATVTTMDQTISAQITAGGAGADDMGTAWLADNAWQDTRTLGENTNGGGANQDAVTVLTGTTAGDDALTITAVGKIAGALGGDLTISVIESGVAKGAETFVFDAAANTLIIDKHATTAAADLNTRWGSGTGAGVTFNNGAAGEAITDYLTISAAADTGGFIGTLAAATTDEMTVAGMVTTTTKGEGDLNVTEGNGYEPVSIQYNNDATTSVASVANTATTAMTLTAATVGTSLNDISIRFYDNGAITNPAVPVATYVAADNALYINIDDAATTSDMVMTAIALEGTFTAGQDDSDPNNQYSSAAMTVAGIGAAMTLPGSTVAGNTGSSGGAAGTLFMYVEEGVTTAADAITALGQTWNERAASLFTITSSQDNDGSGLLFEAANADQLISGVDGGAVTATGAEVVTAFTNNVIVSAVVGAALATGETGVTAMTSFDEAVTYGSAAALTGMQFLAPEGARDIQFVSVAGESLSVDFTTTPDALAAASATLSGFNANASLVFTAINQGEDFDDMIVRFKAADNTITDNVVTYDKRESASEAYVTFDTPASDANMILTAAANGDDFNNVTINFQVDAGVTNASASYSEATKTLTVLVQNDATTAAQIMTAIDAEGTFTTEVDFAAERDNDSSGNGFATLVGTNGTDGVWNVGSTGTTGGRQGGTLEFILADGIDTAADVVTLLNNDNLANKSFTAAAFSAGNDGGAISYRNDTNTAISAGGVMTEGKMTVHLATNAAGIVTTTAADLVSHMDPLTDAATRGVSVSLLDGNDGSGLLAVTATDLDFTSAGVSMTDAAASGTVTAVNGVDARFTITAVNAGTLYDDVTLQYVGDGTKGSETAEYEAATKVITVHVDPTAGTGTTAAEVETAIETDLTALFSVTQDPAGDGTGVVTLQDTTTLSGGSVNTGTEDGASMRGNADLSNAGLTFRASNYGSDSFVSIKALSGTFNLTDSTGATSDRSVGTDVDIRINGIQAIGDGLRASINTSSLDLSFAVSSTVAAGASLDFTITGGGAQFQLGPDVVSNQQARLGIQSVNTAKLGGVSGRLFELRSGGAKALENDVKGAANVVEEVITQVTTLRGRLGAFQKTTLETNIASLSDTLENLTEAESSIRDADFAAESAALTRAQILVQAGVSVLSIANSNPQNILALLR